MKYHADPFIAAALAGLASHPASSLQTPEDMAARALALGIATAKALYDGEREPDSERHPENRGEAINLRVDDTIARVVSDLTERMGALESEFEALTSPASPPPKDA